MRFANYFIIPLLCFSIFLFGCSITTTKSKDPVIQNTDQLKNELNHVLGTANVNLAGKEVIANNKKTSELEVRITDGGNIPVDEDLRRTLFRMIAKLIKSHLKDSSEFNSYVVSFLKKIESGTVTKRIWVGDKFSFEELAAPFINIGKKLTSNDAYVYGGTVFTNADSELICVLRDYTFVDTSAVTFKVYKGVQDNAEPIGEKSITIHPYENYVCQRVNIQPLFDSHGAGKYKLEFLSHDTIIAAKDFEIR